MGQRLALDYGLARVGVAIGSSLAREYKTLKNDEQLVIKLTDIIRDENIDQLIIGMPIRSDGGRGTIAPLIDDLVSRLKRDHPYVLIEMIDEAYSTSQAESDLKEAGLSVAEAKDRVDQYAAKIILDQYNSENPVNL